MKKALLAVALLAMSGAVFATTYRMVGGFIVSGAPIGTPHLVQIGNTSTYLSQADCDDARKQILRAPVTKAYTNAQGKFDQNEAWSGVNGAYKTDASACIETN